MCWQDKALFSSNKDGRKISFFIFFLADQGSQ